MAGSNRRAVVFQNGHRCGTLTEHLQGYTFEYDEAYLKDTNQPPVSLSFPKATATFHSKSLFPFFYGLLSEGANKDIQCRLLKIDEKDEFGRLLKTTGADTIGAITLKSEE